MDRESGTGYGCAHAKSLFCFWNGLVPGSQFSASASGYVQPQPRKARPLPGLQGALLLASSSTNLWLSLFCCPRWTISLYGVQVVFMPWALLWQTTSLVVDSQNPKWVRLMWLVLFQGQNTAGITFAFLCLVYHNALELPQEARLYYRELNMVSTKTLLGEANVFSLVKQILQIMTIFANR